MRRPTWTRGSSNSVTGLIHLTGEPLLRRESDARPMLLKVERKHIEPDLVVPELGGCSGKLKQSGGELRVAGAQGIVEQV